MLVKNYMTRHPVMIESHKQVMEAQRVMAESKIRHLPVVGDGKRLLGLVTPQRLQIHPERLASLNVWEITRFLAELTVDKVMIHGKGLTTISPEATLEDAAMLMIKHKLNGLPVVEGDIVVGIITDTDLLIEFGNLLGANDDGWRATVRVPNRSGEFAKLYSAILGRGWGIMAAGSVRSPKVDDHWDLVVKIRGGTEEEVAEMVAGVGGQELTDLRHTDRMT